MKRALIRTFRLLPQPVRDKLRTLGPVAALRRSFEKNTALHDMYYTDEYYNQEGFVGAHDSARKMSRLMIEHFRPADVLDVGCGPGDYLEAFRDAGIPGHGIELAEAALRRCREKGLEVVRVDLTRAAELPWKADLVYSFEVAEHIAERSAPGFVRALTAAARKHVCLTAAPPGQAGLCHVNCQPKSYWARLFGDCGFQFDEALTQHMERVNTDAGLLHWLCHNLMVFHAPEDRRG